ncbi:MAG TPA: hypothetical protein VHE30_28515 [Polyangiaceae bacterium]|nr:hypothetical protein [Polyangiaceae bacterium]
MHPQPLINAVVQETMILVAHLATAGGVRAPLANVANQVFADLSAQLSAQGVTKSVIADMFGMALSTYHRRARAAAASRTDVGRSVWEAVVEFVQVNEPVSGAAVLSRFSADDATVVSGVLTDLTDSGVVYRAGRGGGAVYRIANPEDFASTDEDVRRRAERHIVGLATVRRGPIGAAALAEEVRQSVDVCEAHLESLVRDGLVEKHVVGTKTVYESRRWDVPVGQAEGWEAAVLDHFQAVVTGICIKLRAGTARSSASDAVGGSTYTLEVWPGHPLEEEARGTLSRFRAALVDLRARIDRHNETNACPPDGRDREVTVYVGQYVKTNDDGENEHAR